MTKVNSIGGMEQPQNPQKIQNKTPLKPDKRMEIREGMRIADVQANGSEAQKLAAKAFDIEPDGIYDKAETEFFNSFRFAIDQNKKEFRAHNTKTGCSVIIKYDDLNHLKQLINLIRSADTHAKGGTITYDLKQKSCTYNGVSKNDISVSALANTFTIKNCDCKTIHTHGFEGKLKILSTANLGVIRNHPTQIFVTEGKEPELYVDNDSKVEIKRFER